VPEGMARNGGNRPDEIEKAVLELRPPDGRERTTPRNGQEADIVKVALLGTASQRGRIFARRDGKNGDAMSTRSVLRAKGMLPYSRINPKAR